MNCVGIDVSKGKSMIAVMRPFGEVVVSPFEARHTANELSELAGLLKSLDGETRVAVSYTHLDVYKRQAYHHSRHVAFLPACSRQFRTAVH